MAQHKGHGFGRLVENTPTWLLLILVVILGTLLYINSK